MNKIYSVFIILNLLVFSVIVQAAQNEFAYGKYHLADFSVELQPRGSFLISDFEDYTAEVFDQGLAEVVAYDAQTKRAFIVNQGKNRVDIVDISDINAPVSVSTIALSKFGEKPVGLAVNPAASRREIAVSLSAEPRTDPGRVVFFDTDGSYLSDVTVGALPDYITFTPDGKTLLVANEGETNDEVTVNPRGSVSFIDISKGAVDVGQDEVVSIDFEKFNGQEEELAKSGVRIFGVTGERKATVAEDLEPESLTVSRDSKTAWLTLQENNAVAEIDIKQRVVNKIFGLGFKDHALPRNGMDVSDRDEVINITNWPVKGMYLPDNVAQFYFGGESFLATVNEGSARQEDGFEEVARVQDLQLSENAFPNASELQQDEKLGRLVVTLFPPQGVRKTEDGEVFEELYAFGGRSFSIWTMDGKQVFDSGDDFEQITAQRLPDNFNSSNRENASFDDRSDDRGPEPSGLVAGKVRFDDFSRTFAFIVLERIGGVMVYDITNPHKVRFVDYVNPRNFEGDAEAGTADDLKPSSLTYVPAAESPTTHPLLLVANAVSGNMRIYELVIAKDIPAP